MRRVPSAAIVAAATIPLAACRDVQSALSPLGPAAERIALLAWVLFIGGTAIMLLVLALTVLAVWGGERWRLWLSREKTIIGGGIVFPVVTLTLLLGYGLFVLRAGYAAPGEGETLRVEVVGEQWWWRVIYEGEDGSRVEAANEIRIPTGRPVRLVLTTADVIHSLWVPNLAGKVDMIPGRANTLTLEAGRAGISRGQCAEYCGGAHALMAFNVVAMEPADFAEWLAGEGRPAAAPADAQTADGLALFHSHGCAACHTIRGTGADGSIGPDLTHVGGRTSLGAGILPNTVGAIAAWIEDNQHLKPENRMPPYGVFEPAELLALSHYLASLK
jgi:cytochrome c oxidase subunit 2